MIEYTASNLDHCNTEMLMVHDEYEVCVINRLLKSDRQEKMLKGLDGRWSPTWPEPSMPNFNSRHLVSTTVAAAIL